MFTFGIYRCADISKWEHVTMEINVGFNIQKKSSTYQGTLDDNQCQYSTPIGNMVC